MEKLGLVLILGLGLLVEFGSTMPRKRDASDSSSEEEPKAVKLFKIHDRNGDGKITLEEFLFFLEEGDGMGRDRLEQFVNEIDTDKNGSVSLEEFFKAYEGEEDD